MDMLLALHKNCVLRCSSADESDRQVANVLFKPAGLQMHLKNAVKESPHNFPQRYCYEKCSLTLTDFYLRRSNAGEWLMIHLLCIRS